MRATHEVRSFTPRLRVATADGGDSHGDSSALAPNLLVYYELEPALSGAALRPRISQTDMDTKFELDSREYGRR